jgi:hypothetical protein
MAAAGDAEATIWLQKSVAVDIPASAEDDRARQAKARFANGVGSLNAALSS